MRDRYPHAPSPESGWRCSRSGAFRRRLGELRAAPFYDDFPGLGRSWVAADGPYNEHLVRDVGALNLALARHHRGGAGDARPPCWSGPCRRFDRVRRAPRRRTTCATWTVLDRRPVSIGASLALGRSSPSCSSSSRFGPRQVAVAWRHDAAITADPLFTFDHARLDRARRSGPARRRHRGRSPGLRDGRRRSVRRREVEPAPALQPARGRDRGSVRSTARTWPRWTRSACGGASAWSSRPDAVRRHGARQPPRGPSRSRRRDCAEVLERVELDASFLERPRVGALGRRSPAHVPRADPGHRSGGAAHGRADVVGRSAGHPGARTARAPAARARRRLHLGDARPRPDAAARRSGARRRSTARSRTPARSRISTATHHRRWRGSCSVGRRPPREDATHEETSMADIGSGWRSRWSSWASRSALVDVARPRARTKHRVGDRARAGPADRGRSALQVLLRAGAVARLVGALGARDDRLRGGDGPAPAREVPAGLPAGAGRVRCASAVLVLGILFGFGVFELDARTLIPLAGLMIGNSMTATVLVARRLVEELRDKRAEVEARLALGSRQPTRRALRPRRPATALIPQIETTKAVGLIFLPAR